MYHNQGTRNCILQSCPHIYAVECPLKNAFAFLRGSAKACVGSPPLFLAIRSIYERYELSLEREDKTFWLGVVKRNSYRRITVEMISRSSIVARFFPTQALSRKQG